MSFLGIAECYLKFIPITQKTTLSLHQLLKVDPHGSGIRPARPPSRSRRMIYYSSVFSHFSTTGYEKRLTYASRSLSDAERNSQRVNELLPVAGLLNIGMFTSIAGISPFVLTIRH